MKMGIKSIEWDRSNKEEGQVGLNFASAANYVVGGPNSYSGKFGDEEASMLWFDGKGVAHCKKSSTGVAQDTESVNGEINEVDRFKSLFEFG